MAVSALRFRLSFERSPHMYFRKHTRRGITSVLAMLYLTLFTTLALGFYAAVSTSLKVASNEQSTARALRASESGMAFIKYHLANLDVPANTASDSLFDTVYGRLQTRLNGYPNMGGNTIAINA